MRMKILALLAVFLFVAGTSPELMAQNTSMSKKPPAEKKYDSRPSKPEGPAGHRPGPGGSGPGRPGGEPGSGKPGWDGPGSGRPGGDGPGYGKPGGGGSGYGKPGGGGSGYGKPGHFRDRGRKRPNNDCWPYGCDGYYYNYYYEDPTPPEPRDQNITITIIEPEPQTYFSSGPFEFFDDPRDK